MKTALLAAALSVSFAASSFAGEQERAFLGNYNIDCGAGVECWLDIVPSKIDTETMAVLSVKRQGQAKPCGYAAVVHVDKGQLVEYGDDWTLAISHVPNGVSVDGVPFHLCDVELNGSYVTVEE